MFLQCFFQFDRVYIALKGDFQLGLFGFVNGAVQCYGFAPFDVSFGSIKMRISRYDVSFMN